MRTLQEIINRAEKLVFFGGAGVSTASGIPAFRGENGLYRQTFCCYEPERILSDLFLALHPETFFDFYRTVMLHPEARPNTAHLKLTALEQVGKLHGVVTQNIDGLHRMAGTVRLYELHGSCLQNECVACGKNYSMAWMLNTHGIPLCEKCGEMVRPCITLYGEAPDHYVMMGARRVIAECDTLIVAGTSLTVEPAASCLDAFHGRELVVIDPGDTRIDERATFILRNDVSEAFESVSAM